MSADHYGNRDLLMGALFSPATKRYEERKKINQLNTNGYKKNNDQNVQRLTGF
jgi:hypothetical protein